jgi:hypothetical protein
MELEVLGVRGEEAEVLFPRVALEETVRLAQQVILDS